MAALQLREFIYEPEKVHDRKVVEDYNNLVLSYEDGLLNITDEDELAKVEKQLEGFMMLEPTYLEPIMDLAGIYELMGEKQLCDDLLEDAYKIALNHVTIDKEGNWYDVIEWAWLENRCIIRALQNGAQSRWEKGNTKEAKKVFQNLLKCNPGDNSGVRYHVLAILEGMTARQFDTMMGDTGFVPDNVPKWFDKQAKLHPEFKELLERWGDLY